GTVLLGGDDAVTRAIVPRIRRRVLTYGAHEACDLRVVEARLEGLRSRFRLEMGTAAEHAFGRGKVGSADLGEFVLPRPGMHNVVDATAAIGIGLLLGCDLEVVRAGIGEFRGVDRRFQIRGAVNGVTVVDDYGHHPTELAATLAAARGVVEAEGEGGRVLMIFQPHRYTRTQHLMREFAQVMGMADRAWLLDIYAASERPIAGV